MIGFLDFVQKRHIKREGINRICHVSDNKVSLEETDDYFYSEYFLEEKITERLKKENKRPNVAICFYTRQYIYNSERDGEAICTAEKLIFLKDNIVYEGCLELSSESYVFYMRTISEVIWEKEDWLFIKEILIDVSSNRLPIITGSLVERK